jgi:hypothetical protein
MYRSSRRRIRQHKQTTIADVQDQEQRLAYTASEGTLPMTSVMAPAATGISTCSLVL